MLSLSVTAIVLTLIFLAGWVWASRIKNASIVDAIWALSLPIPVLIYVFCNGGSPLRKSMLLAMASIWSLRLGIHLAKRIYTHYPVEDARYKSLRQNWDNSSVNRNFFILFLTNATLVFLLSLPFYLSSFNTTTINLVEITGLVLFSIGFIGESLSDYQLRKFREKNTTKQVCDIGLWHYSRHPNYFFEAVIWIGIYTFSCGSVNGLYTIHAPLIIIFLLTKVTGIPPAEKSSMKSKGDAYLKYKKTTSSFIPWFKKKS